MGTPSAAVFAQLGIAATSPVNVFYDFVSESMGKRGSIIEHNGLRGTRSRHGGRTRQGIYRIGGTIVMEPSPEELATLLPWILGAVASGTTFALAETIPSRYVTIDKVAKVMEYAGCYVARATFSAGENSPLRMELEIVGKTETIGNAGSFPSATYGNTPPFTLHDTASGVTLSGTGSRAIKSWSMTVDNGLIVAFNNSQSANELVAGDRMVSTSIVTPYSSSETDLYDQAAAGAAATVVFTNGAYSCTFAFANLQVPADTPGAGGRGAEIALGLNGMARMASTTRELIVTLDSTP